MTINFGYVPAASTLYIPFATYNSDGASVTITGLAVTDIEIYKNGSVTQRASDAGFTLLDTDGIDFDGITGIHGFSIDLNDNTDAGFYSAGAQYTVVVSSITADGQTVNFIPAVFRIGPAEANVSQFGGEPGTFASGIPEVALTTSSIGSVADQVWDEATSGHVASGSFGASQQPTDHGTAQGGGASTITLRTGAVNDDDYYNKQLLKIVAGTGAGQSEYIDDYTGATRVATMATAWNVLPDSTSVYVIHEGGTIPGASAPSAGEVADQVWDEARADHVSAGSFGQYFATAFRSGTAQAGGASTITLDAGASATNNLYQYSEISIIGGTGAGQSRQISAYVGASKIATVGVNWAVNPASDSVFIITPLGVDAATVAAIATGVWAATRAANATAGSFGEYVNADVLRLSGDATAADNAEAMFDGTGYAGGTIKLGVDAVAISGDTAAANNLEAALDGTGGVTITAALTGAITGDITGNLSGSVGSVTGAVGSVTGAVGSVTGNVGGNVTGTVGSLAAQAKADVNAEVVDCLATDTYAEPGQGAPASTAPLSTKVGFLYKAWRNHSTQTASEYALYADDTTTKDQEAVVTDDGTTFDRGEVGTGA